MVTCNCMGPQGGQPLCPCQMRALASVDSSVLVGSTRLIGDLMEWQPIETAPKNETEILACWDAPNPEYRARGVIRWFLHDDPADPGGGFWASIPGYWRKEPTHWMPLPELPPITGR